MKDMKGPEADSELPAQEEKTAGIEITARISETGSFSITCGYPSVHARGGSMRSEGFMSFRPSCSSFQGFWKACRRWDQEGDAAARSTKCDFSPSVRGARFLGAQCRFLRSGLARP
jgi:hypothetical protein